MYFCDDIIKFEVPDNCFLIKSKNNFSYTIVCPQNCCLGIRVLTPERTKITRDFLYYFDRKDSSSSGIYAVQKNKYLKDIKGLSTFHIFHQPVLYNRMAWRASALFYRHQYSLRVDWLCDDLNNISAEGIGIVNSIDVSINHFNRRHQENSSTIHNIRLYFHCFLTYLCLLDECQSELVTEYYMDEIEDTDSLFYQEYPSYYLVDLLLFSLQTGTSRYATLRKELLQMINSATLPNGRCTNETWTDVCCEVQSFMNKNKIIQNDFDAIMEALVAIPQSWPLGMVRQDWTEDGPN